MARVLQVIDVDADGFKVRLDNGAETHLRHTDGSCPTIGEEVSDYNTGKAQPFEYDPTPAKTTAPPAPKKTRRKRES